MNKINLIAIICLTVLSYNFSYSFEKNFLYVTPKAGVNLRQKPSVDSKIVLLIPYKSKVKVISQKTLYSDIIISDRPGRWLEISYNGKTGYAFDGFLSEIEPDDNTSIFGEYIMKVDLKQYSPSHLFIYKNNTFKYYINLCEGFGKIYGKYSIKNNILKMKIENSSFNIAEKDKIEIILKIENNKLYLINTIPAADIGCDFKKNDIFIKK